MLFQLLFGVSRTYAYTVHEGPRPPSDRMDRAEALRFIKDGFQMPAALTAPLWFAVHHLWLPLAGYVAIALTLAAAHAWLGLPVIAFGAGMIALHLMAGFEADAFERADLERQGWSTLGAVTGASALECQRRFFDEWLPRQPILSGHSPATKPPMPADPMTKTAITTARGGQSAAGRLAALWRGKSS